MVYVFYGAREGVDEEGSASASAIRVAIEKEEQRSWFDGSGFYDIWDSRRLGVSPSAI